MAEDRPEGFGGTPEDASRAVLFLKTLSHEVRLQILCLLIDGQQNVGELAAALDQTTATISQQLMRLRAEGIVVATRHGKSVYYALKRPEVSPVIAALRDAFCRPR